MFFTLIIIKNPPQIIFYFNYNKEHPPKKMVLALIYLSPSLKDEPTWSGCRYEASERRAPGGGRGSFVLAFVRCYFFFGGGCVVSGFLGLRSFFRVLSFRVFGVSAFAAKGFLGPRATGQRGFRRKIYKFRGLSWSGLPLFEGPWGLIRDLGSRISWQRFLKETLGCMSSGSIGFLNGEPKIIIPGEGCRLSCFPGQQL